MQPGPVPGILGGARTSWTCGWWPDPVGSWPEEIDVGQEGFGIYKALRSLGTGFLRTVKAVLILGLCLC